MNTTTINNDALAEFVKNTFDLTVMDGTVEPDDWDWAMDSLDELISCAEDLRYTLDGLDDDERVDWLRKNGLGLWAK